MYIHMYVYIYIYIYIERERERAYHIILEDRAVAREVLRPEARRPEALAPVPLYEQPDLLLFCRMNIVFLTKSYILFVVRGFEIEKTNYRIRYFVRLRRPAVVLEDQEERLAPNVSISVLI